jgi:hypothetical protein
LTQDAAPLSLSVCNILGRQVELFSSIKINQVFWNTSHRNFPQGLYIAKAELPDGSTVSQALMVQQ